MLETQTFNGWTNHETWCVNLWLTNEPETDETLRMLAQMNASEYWRAERLKDYVEGMAPEDTGATMFVDLLRGALDNVNWREIVKHHEDDDAPELLNWIFQARLAGLRGTENEPYPRIEDCIGCGQLFEPDRKGDDICTTCA